MAQNSIRKTSFSPKLLHKFKESFWAKVALIQSIYLCIQFLSLSLSSLGWTKYWVLQDPDNFQYWDARIYAQLSLAPACTAFYPLWPRLLQWLAVPVVLTQSLRFSILFSELIFLISLPIALFTFERILKSKAIAFLAVFLYALGPNAIFYSIGYTESLFGFLSLLFLLMIHALECSNKVDKFQTVCCYCILLLVVVLLSLTRPILIQSGFAIAFALSILWFFQALSQRSCTVSASHLSAISARVFSIVFTITIGNIAGYSIYGFYCLQSTGNFFTPFHAQIEWGRTFGFRPWLLIFPRTLLIDLHGLYTGLLLFAAIAWLLWAYYRGVKFPRLALPRQPWIYVFLIHPLLFLGLIGRLNRASKRLSQSVKPKDISLGSQYLFRFSILYAIAFSSIHSVINFLANTGNLYSTSRHFFGTPFAFIGIGALLTFLAIPQLNRTAWFVAIMGVLLLAEQWMSFTTDGWLG